MRGGSARSHGSLPLAQSQHIRRLGEVLGASIPSHLKRTAKRATARHAGPPIRHHKARFLPLRLRHLAWVSAFESLDVPLTCSRQSRKSSARSPSTAAPSPSHHPHHEQLVNQTRIFSLASRHESDAVGLACAQCTIALILHRRRCASEDHEEPDRDHQISTRRPFTSGGQPCRKATSFVRAARAS